MLGISFFFTINLLAAIPHPDDWIEGTGLIETIIIILALFIISLPFFLIRARIRRETLQKGADSALEFAVNFVMDTLQTLVFIIIFVGVPFGILNMIGMAITGHQFYLPIILPGLLGLAVLVWYYWKKTR